MFRRLSVLSGAFPLAAAEVIAAAPGDIDPFEIFDVLSRLVDKSLLIVEDTSSADVRYRLLETMRQYGSDRAKAADELVVLRDAHADWWTAWMEALTPTVPTDENVDEISAAYENCRAALEWRIEQPEAAARLTRCLIGVWLFTGRFTDAVSLAGRAERAAGDDPVAAAVILTYSFYARLLAGEPCDGERSPRPSRSSPRPATTRPRPTPGSSTSCSSAASTRRESMSTSRSSSGAATHGCVTISWRSWRSPRSCVAISASPNNGRRRWSRRRTPARASSGSLLEMSILGARGQIAACRDIAVELLAVDAAGRSDRPGRRLRDRAPASARWPATGRRSSRA